jgi:YggT family protein
MVPGRFAPAAAKPLARPHPRLRATGAAAQMASASFVSFASGRLLPGRHCPGSAGGPPPGRDWMLIALIDVLIILLSVLWWIIIIQAIFSWLIVFNVINTYNDFVRSFIRALDRITEPLYRPVRRIMPDFGGIDFTPFVILIVIMVVDRLLRGVKMDLLASYV